MQRKLRNKFLMNDKSVLINLMLVGFIIPNISYAKKRNFRGKDNWRFCEILLNFLWKLIKFGPNAGICPVKIKIINSAYDKTLN